LLQSLETELNDINVFKAALRERFISHLQSLGLQIKDGGFGGQQNIDKDIIRKQHASQREDRLFKSEQFLISNVPRLLRYFANGDEVCPEKISPIMQRVYSNTWQAGLFRLASLTWSVPVSSGFGRRIRYLVWDQNNGKLIGLIAIGDPVFNLTVRDNLIGWDAQDRKSRLVNIMDAYVLGAVPPYNSLLGGKLVASLLRSRDIYDDFKNIYGSTEGVISKQVKSARLIAVTTSSSMGRSSVYNRLKLEGKEYLQPIGYTRGWGHFHIPDSLFNDFREYLRLIGHRYADHYEFGQGPNWRLRTISAALTSLGFEHKALRHGIKRQVFICKLADNAFDVLRTGECEPDTASLLKSEIIGDLARDRWMIPRAERRPEFRFWKTEQLLELLGSTGSKIKAHNNSSLFSA